MKVKKNLGYNYTFVLFLGILDHKKRDLKIGEGEEVRPGGGGKANIF